MGKLRHIAIAVSDPWQAAEFYERAFGLKRVAEARASIGDAVFVSDGVVNISLCRYNNDEAAGNRGKDYVGLHHIGFWVDDIDEARAKVESAGARFWMGEVPEDRAKNVFYEIKYLDPDGVIVDLTHSGWSGASKDPSVSLKEIA